jgi:hypothetical protein
VAQLPFFAQRINSHPNHVAAGILVPPAVRKQNDSGAPRCSAADIRRSVRNSQKPKAAAPLEPVQWLLMAVAYLAILRPEDFVNIERTISISSRALPLSAGLPV